ncbi:Sas10/Utp3/C1D family-domain-containing protein [Pilobolus umbonatus]|nr:Sas10/Utp3/C1D family-domain-containing protein [Pilobolus umbonatus]
MGTADIVPHPVEDAPNEMTEFYKIIKDIKAKIIDVKKYLKPFKEKVDNNEYETSKGVSFLEVKYQLMLQYIIQLAYYVHLKLSGKQVENNPVIDSLIELRVILDKMKPIEGKLKYQIDKLVRAAVVGTQKAEDAGKEMSTTEAIAADPLAFKPNPMNLLNKDNNDNMEDDEEEDANDGVYKPPKLAPVNYDESKDRKKGKMERDEMRLKQKSSRSRIMKDLVSELSENPEEIGIFGGVNEGTGYGDKVDGFIADKNKYEEENYVRLAVTRKEKRRLKSNNKMRLENEFDNLNDFANLAGLRDVEEQENQRYRNVLNRKKLKGETIDTSRSKRSREDGDEFEGLINSKKKLTKFSGGKKRSHKKKH